MLWLPQGGISDGTLRHSGSSDPLRKGAAAIMYLYLMMEQTGTAGLYCRRCASLVRMTIQMGREGRGRRERKDEGETGKEEERRRGKGEGQGQEETGEEGRRV